MKILPALPRLYLLVSLLMALHLPGAEPPAAAASPAEIPLWPDGVPNAKTPARGETSNSGNYRNVSNPRLLVYAPPPGTANGTAFVYSPGGGYSQIAGAGPSSITQWMNSLGVTVFVLLYRLEAPDYPAALQDAVQAMRVVRSRSKEFGLDPKRIGAGGGSAGAHLAGSLGAFYNDPVVAKVGGQLEALSAKPDFLILFFPVVTMDVPAAERGSRHALLGPNPPSELVDKMSLEKQVTKDMPPIFLIHTMQDTTAPVENSLLLFSALRKAGASVEMHIFEKGAHSSGLYANFGTTATWPTLAEEWMRAHGWLPDSPTSLMYRGATAVASPAQGQPMLTVPRHYQAPAPAAP
jgi:acetyl esterase/lipase